MELGMVTGIWGLMLESDVYSLVTVTVELEILIRESIWHLCITETNLSDAFDERRKESRRQRNGAGAHEGSANVIFSPFIII
jgi:hypothetical protein